LQAVVGPDLVGGRYPHLRLFAFAMGFPRNVIVGLKTAPHPSAAASPLHLQGRGGSGRVDFDLVRTYAPGDTVRHTRSARADPARSLTHAP
jgi:hypothetical protein